MTNLRDEAIETVKDLPPSSQEEIAQVMLALASGPDDNEPIDLFDVAAVLEGVEQAERGQFASPDRVAKAVGLAKG
jgi:hypothetical protein